MRRHLLQKLTFTLFVLLGLASWNSMRGQGSESFENENDTTFALKGYSDGSFVGDGGITWNFIHSRDVAEFPIAGKGIMLRRSDIPSSSLSATIPGGIGNFSVDTRKAYPKDLQRQLELLINNVRVATFEPAFASGTDDTMLPFVVNNINQAETVELLLRVYGEHGNRQIVLDNISWNGYVSSAVSSTEAPGLVIAPNPVIDLLYITAPDELYAVQVVSTGGNVVKELKLIGDAQVTLPVGDLPKGLYLIRITTVSGENLIGKMIKG